MFYVKYTIVKWSVRLYLLFYLPVAFLKFKIYATKRTDQLVKEFKGFLAMRNKFGVEDSGFSSPHTLFNHKDLKEDLRNYQFDLKNDEHYYYVILREIDDGTARQDGYEDSEWDEECVGLYLSIFVLVKISYQSQ